jgi:hypothetical protein
MPMEGQATSTGVRAVLQRCLLPPTQTPPPSAHFTQAPPALLPCDLQTLRGHHHDHLKALVARVGGQCATAWLAAT